MVIVVDLLHPPISVVDHSFVEDSLFPATSDAIAGPLSAGGVFLVVVDAAREGDYIVERIRSWALSGEIGCVEHRVAQEDPFLVWTDLMGQAEVPGSLVPATHLRVILVSGACWVPAELLRDWLDTMTARAKAASAVVVFPVLRSTDGGLRNKGNGILVFDVPEFRTVKKSRREELCRALLEQQLGQFDDAREVSQELVERGPSSRTELEGWIESVAEAVREEESVLNFDEICARRLAVRPGVVSSREALRSSLRAAEEKMQEADRAFQEWQGRVLLYSIRPLADPFLAVDSLYWFVSTISHLSCRLDCVDGAFWFLVTLRRDTTDPTDLICSEEPGFFVALRSLRTLFQHGLVENERKNRETIQVAETWFRCNCGAASPERHHWRKLTAAIVKEWDGVVARLAEVISVAPRCAARATVADGMNRAARRLARHQWKEVAGAVVREVDPRIDVDRFVEKYQQRLSAELRQASVATEGVKGFATSLVEKYMIAELDVCPIRPQQLIEKGVMGRRLGMILREANRVWKGGDTNKEALWKHLAARYEELDR